MDVSVVAAVGSFFMSERVLKPKATVLFILGIILAYDLTTKTHDVSSLRVYRGPALLAFTLMMSAFSLRTWRRNGVACDELLFLPGTAHGITHGVDCPPLSVRGSSSNNNNQIITSGNKTNNNTISNIIIDGNTKANAVTDSGSKSSIHDLVLTSRPSAQHCRSEGDIAAGVPDALDLRRRSRSMEESQLDLLMEESNKNHNTNRDNNAPSTKNSKRGITVEEMRQNSGINKQEHQSLLGDVELTSTKSSNIPHRQLRSDSFDSSLGWGSDEDDELLSKKNCQDDSQLPAASGMSQSNGAVEERGCLSGRANLLFRTANQISQEDSQLESAEGLPLNPDGGHNQHGLDLHHFRENHPRITRIGSFFFFRSSSSSTHNAAYAPSGPAVVGAALDLSMPVLFNFHLFIEAFNHIKPKDADSEVPAKILPIIFLSVLIVRSVIPPGRRGRFWSTLKFTVMSPFHRVRFRDAFIGDVITSMVRPGQDLVFAFSYYVTVIWGTLSGKYGLSESGRILEGSWILHNVILPSCALLPLWWKFLQTLRQAYDEERRWPHLGNALKFLTATLVILYGMTHPENRRSPWWIVAFLCSLLYQIWWDVIMDWDLLEIPPNHFRSTLDALSVENWLTNISSLRPESHLLMTIQMYIFTPIAESWRRTRARISSLQHIRLRTRRLYKTEGFYWRILVFNAVARFTWMLCFIPAYRLSSSGEEKVTTFSSDVNSYVGVILPLTELVRRCFWGILFLERKTIEMTDDDAIYSRLESSANCSNEEEGLNDLSNSAAMDEQLSGGHSQTGKGAYHMYLPLWLNAEQQMQHDAPVHSSMGWSISSHQRLQNILQCFEPSEDLIHNLYMVELGLWAAAFVGLGCWAAS